MTQKKILIFALVLVPVSAALVFYKSSGPKTKNSDSTTGDAVSIEDGVDSNLSGEAFQRDIDKLEAVLALPIADGETTDQAKEAWRNLRDFTKAVEDIVSEESALALREQVKLKAPAIMDCLKKDLCGTSKDSPEDTYFDDLHTPAHALLERLFEVNLEIQELTGAGALDDKTLLAAFSDTNETIQGLALEAYLGGSNESSKFNEVLAREEAFNGDAAAKLYQILLGTGGLPDDTRAEVIERLSRKLLEGDPLTHVALAESLQQLTLTSNEAEQLMPALCRFHNDPDNHHNWLIVRHHIKAIGLSTDQCASL